MISHRVQAAAFVLVATVLPWDSSIAAAAESTETASDSIQVEVRDGLLTLDARDVGLDRVLRAIGEKAEFDVLIDSDLSAPVNRSFADVPVDQGVRRLLAGVSFLMLFSRSDDASRLTLLHVYTGTPQIGAGRVVQPEVRVVEEPSQEELESWVRSRLASSDRSTRIVAVRRLTRLEPKVAAEIAARILRSDDDPVVRGQAAVTLGKINGEGISRALEIALTDEEASVRIHAVKALGEVGDEHAIEVLGQVVFGDPDREMRLAAIEALARIGTDSSRQYLDVATSDHDAEVRDVARKALESWDRDDHAASPARAARPGAPGDGMPYRGGKLIK